MPVNGRPLLEWWLRTLTAAGVGQFLVNLHHHAGPVRRWVRSSPFARRVTLTEEPRLLGTGGTLLANAAFCDGRPILLIHADNLCACPWQAFFSAHAGRPAGTLMTLMTFDSDHPESCGVVETDAGGVVRAFHEKVAHPPGRRANAAVYIVEPQVVDVLASLGKPVIDFSTEVLPHFVGRMATWHNNEYLREHRHCPQSAGRTAGSGRFPGRCRTARTAGQNCAPPTTAAWGGNFQRPWRPPWTRNMSFCPGSRPVFAPDGLPAATRRRPWPCARRLTVPPRESDHERGVWWSSAATPFPGPTWWPGPWKRGIEVAGISRSAEPDPVFLPYRWNGTHQKDSPFTATTSTATLDAIAAMSPALSAPGGGQLRRPGAWWPKAGNIPNTGCGPTWWPLSASINGCGRWTFWKSTSTPRPLRFTATVPGRWSKSTAYAPSSPYAVSKAAIDMSLMTFFRHYRFPV